MIASVGCSMVASGTVSTRTSRLPCQATAFIGFPFVGSLGVALPSPSRRPTKFPPGANAAGARPRRSDQADENERADEQQDRSGDRVAPPLQPVSGELVSPA